MPRKPLMLSMTEACRSYRPIGRHIRSVFLIVDGLEVIVSKVDLCQKVNARRIWARFVGCFDYAVLAAHLYRGA
jgi:hypothetical protein